MSNGYGRSTDGFGITRESSVNLIIKTALDNGVTNPKQIAYMLATAEHETRNFQAPEEDYGRSQARKLGYHGGEEYFGRGYVHLTHIENYQAMDRKLGLGGRLSADPGLARDPEIAAKALVIGMRDGMFTGRKLDRYINDQGTDYEEARRIVNGKDKAAHIAGLARGWEQNVPALIENVKKNGVQIVKEERPQHSQNGRTTGSASAMADGVLKENERGQEVRDLQSKLAALGYKGADGKQITPDGHFGANTKHALEAFQKDHDLKQDGIAGRDTLRALANEHQALTAVYKQGAEGQGVRDIQAQLSALGYTGKDGKPLQADGQFGADTKYAAEQFQRAHKLDVDGVMGLKSNAALQASKQHPLLTETTHPDNKLYAKLRDGAGDHVSNEHVAALTEQARRAGIKDAASVRDVVQVDSQLYVRSTVPTIRAQVDLSEQAKAIEQTSQHTQLFTEAQKQQHEQIRNQNLSINV